MNYRTIYPANTATTADEIIGMKAGSSGGMYRFTVSQIAALMPPGPQGPVGPQGPPGEVTGLALDELPLIAAPDDDDLFYVVGADGVDYATTRATLMAGATVAIGGTIGNSPTAGSVLFIGSGGVLAQDNANLFWDDANNRLGVGTASPAGKVDVSNSDAAVPMFRGKAHASQSAPIFIVRNNADSATLFEVGPAGRLIGTGDGLALGVNNVIGGGSSWAFGSGNNVSATNSIAVGILNVVSQGNSFAFGLLHSVGHVYSCALGNGVTTTAGGQLGFSGWGQGHAELALQLLTNSFSVSRNMGGLDGVWASDVEGSQQGRIKFQVYSAATAQEVIRIEANAAGGRLSFFGATAVAQQTGGAATAGGTYGATEQAMLQKVYDVLRAYALMT